jgi:hypothetical protein
MSLADRLFNIKPGYKWSIACNAWIPGNWRENFMSTEPSGTYGQEKTEIPGTTAYNKTDNTCYAKAQAKGELTFTLRAQDASMARTVAYWILENIDTAPAEKLQEALSKAIAVRGNPNRKFAD